MIKLLKKGKGMSVWSFYGKEEFRISAEIKKLRKQLLDETFRAMNFKIFYSPEIEELLSIISTTPLMFGNTLSVIHCENYFFKTKNKKIEFSDEQIKSLDFAMQNISDSNNIVFVCNIARDDNKKPDSRTKLFKTIAKYTTPKDFPEYKDYDKNLNSFLSEMIKEKELVADTKTINFIIQYIGVNLRLIDSELEKIKTAIYPEKKFTQKEITEYCSLKDDIFALADLITSTDKNAVIKQLFSVTEKRHPLEIIALLQPNLHKLLYLKTFEKEQSIQSLSSNLGIPEYPIKNILEKIRTVSLAELSELKHKLTDAEIKIKKGETLNPQQLLESVLLTGSEKCLKI